MNKGCGQSCFCAAPHACVDVLLDMALYLGGYLKEQGRGVQGRGVHRDTVKNKEGVCREGVYIGIP